MCLNCHPKFKLTHNLPDLIVPHEKHKCEVCSKTIASNHRKIHCCACKSTVHIKCNKTDEKSYNSIIKNKLSVICIKCQADNIPFQNLSDIQFAAVSRGNNTGTEIIEDVSVSSISLKTFFNEINKSNPFDSLGPPNNETEEEDALLINCKYVDLCNFNHKTKEKNFSIFHTNIGSLRKHKTELEGILHNLDLKFDVIGITETKLTKDHKHDFDIQMEGY